MFKYKKEGFTRSRGVQYNIKKTGVVEASLRDIDKLPKLSPTDYWLINRDLYINITRKTPQFSPPGGGILLPSPGGEAHTT